MSDTFDPILFCFVGPTASGKSTICRELLQSDSSLMSSVSTTTRAARASEVEGKDYFFVAKEEFEKRVAEGRFLEHAEFAGNRYGTELTNIERAIQEERDLLFDIEVEGVKQLRSSRPDRLVVVFMHPPSMEILRERLESRGANTPEDISRRLQRAEEEIQILSSPGFSNHVLVNDMLPESIEQAKKIISDERARVYLK